MDNGWIVPACLVVMSLSLSVIAAAAVLTAVEVRRTLRQARRITDACETVVGRVAGGVAGIVNRLASLGQEARRWWNAPLEHGGNGTRRERRRS